MIRCFFLKLLKCTCTHTHARTHTSIQAYDRKVMYDILTSLKCLYEPYLKKSLSALSQSFLHGGRKKLTLLLLFFFRFFDIFREDFLPFTYRFLLIYSLMIGRLASEASRGVRNKFNLKSTYG